MESGLASVPAASVGDVADLVGAVAWPLVVLVGIYVLRDPLKALVKRIGTSASSVSVGPGGLKVDFAAAVTTVAPESATVLDDLRSPAPGLADSAAPTLFAQLAAEEPAPHLLVDLGEGREWLSSRLYLFALMLAGMRRTQILVFVETSNGIRGRFVGLAAPLEVRYSLGREYPWLEADYAAAYAVATAPWMTSSPARRRDPMLLDSHGRLSNDVAQQLVNVFLTNIKANPPAAGIDDNDWVNEQVDGVPLHEHGRWLTGGDVERVLGTALERWGYITETTPRSPSEIAAAALKLPGHDGVAVVDDQHRFKGAVVDRRQALEILAAQAPEPEAT